jgi:zinc transport system ATP-binding protein
MLQVDHNKNIIEVKDVSFSYGRDENVLQDITLGIQKGDYIGLIGPNGAGKTTLLKIMLDLLKPKNGTVKLFGQDINVFKAWQKIGYVPQKAVNFDANFPATVFEVVSMGINTKIKLFNRSTAEDKKTAQDSLKKVDMLVYKDKLIGDLSGGQQQRVFIARALVNKPEVIFLDEPTAGIDKEAQDEFYKLLQKLNKEEGITLVLVSHDIDRLMKEVMHIACLDRTLTCHTSPEEYLAASEPLNIHGENVKVIPHHYYS